MKSNLFLPLIAVLLTAAVSFGVNALAATFAEPSSAPPANNAYAPLDTGPNANAKVGGLSLNSGGAINGLIVRSGNVGIGPATSLLAKLDVQGTIRIADGTQGAGKVLTSDANGVASWSSAPASASVSTAPSGSWCGFQFVPTAADEGNVVGTPINHSCQGLGFGGWSPSGGSILCPGGYTMRQVGGTGYGDGGWSFTCMKD